MIIKKDKFEKIIETDLISFCILKDSKINCHSIKFKVRLESNEPINNVDLGDEHSCIGIDDWFKSILSNKIIIDKENSEIEKYFSQKLFVNDVNLPYISKTLFQILERLLPNNLNLISLSYE